MGSSRVHTRAGGAPARRWEENAAGWRSPLGMIADSITTISVDSSSSDDTPHVQVPPSDSQQEQWCGAPPAARHMGQVTPERLSRTDREWGDARRMLRPLLATRTGTKANAAA